MMTYEEALAEAKVIVKTWRNHGGAPLYARIIEPLLDHDRLRQDLLQRTCRALEAAGWPVTSGDALDHELSDLVREIKESFPHGPLENIVKEHPRIMSARGPRTPYRLREHCGVYHGISWVQRKGKRAPLLRRVPMPVNRANKVKR